MKLEEYITILKEMGMFGDRLSGLNTHAVISIHNTSPFCIVLSHWLHMSTEEMRMGISEPADLNIILKQWLTTFKGFPDSTRKLARKYAKLVINTKEYEEVKRLVSLFNGIVLVSRTDEKETVARIENITPF
jgi:hypothetical protein